MKELIVCSLLFILFLIGFIYFGTKEYPVNEISDAQKFESEHKQVSKDNIFSYINSSDAYTYIRGKNVILLIGVKNNDWVGHYAKVIDEVAKELNISSIMYYDITEDKNDNNATYESIVNYLKDYVTYLDNGEGDLYGPTFIIKKNGVITYFDDETALIKGTQSASEYWDNYHTNLKKINITAALKDYLGSDSNGER